MKTLRNLIVATAVLGTGSMFAQPIHDIAVIPVAITINTTMRLNVVSGGNVEFVVNTISQYENGISNPNPGANDRIHDTRFTVASSRNFDVLMFAEDACFVGTDVASAGTINTIALNNVGYVLHANGLHTHAGEVFLISDASENIVSLNNNTANVVVSYNSLSATGDVGGTNDNDYTINWELATSRLISLTGNASLLEQSIPQDRYITNVYLVLLAR